MLWGFFLNSLILITLWMLARKMRSGFVFGLVMESFWFYWSVFVVHDLGFAIFSVLFASIYVWGWWKWKEPA